MKKLVTVAILTSVVSMPAMAAEQGRKPLLNRGSFSIGAGIANNEIDLPNFLGGDQDETGFQFFGAYRLDQVNLMEGVNTSIEAGYMDYGFDGGNSGGVWATGVVDGAISGNLGWLGRLGLDFGDDDGFMLGAGLSLDVGSKAELRGEYVIRDNIDSLQLNLVYRL